MATMTGMSIVVAVMLMNMSRAVCHLHSPTVAPSADLAYGLHTERERAPAMP